MDQEGIPWKSDQSIMDPLSATAIENMKQEINLQPPDTTVNLIKYEDDNCMVSKDVKIETNTNNDHKIDIYCDDTKDILRELVPKCRELPKLKKTCDSEFFDYIDPLNHKGFERELITKGPSCHDQHPNLNLPSITEDKVVKTEHFLTVCDRSVEETSSNSNTNSLLRGEPYSDNYRSGCGEPLCTKKNNDLASTSQSQDANVTATTEHPNICKCGQCNCHIKLKEGEKHNNSANRDSNCDCYKCRRQRFLKTKKRPDLKCNKCGRLYLHKSSLDIHKKANCHLKLVCNICIKGFSSAISFRQHNLSFHVVETGNHQCSSCKKQFPNHHLLCKHKKRCGTFTLVPEISERLFSCEFCQKTYRTKKALDRHCKLLHSREKNFICTHCKEGFSTKGYLIKHFQTRHSLETFRCEICHSSFKLEACLKLHIKKHNGTKNYVCEVCGKAFLFKNSLERHMSVHSREKPYICHLCGKSFRAYSNLQQHSVTHSDERPFVCNECGSAFRIRNHLRQHMAVHGMVNTSTKRKRKH